MTTNRLTSNADPIKTSGGLVSGVQVPGGDVRAYKGIPFAKAPVGDLRWRPPQPASPWTGVLTADKFANLCTQPDPPAGNSLYTKLFATPSEPRSEDCLYLNVWTSASPGDKRPVMVWIHGGGFFGGSAAGEIYDGTALTKKGVVLVSIQYRVWTFGFLAHPDLTKESEHHASGNYGLLDQIAALRWVKENIAAFGGNPDNVTIFGQSAGASSCNFLMASPLAKGLFHRAIGESSSAYWGPEIPGSILGRPLPLLAEAEADGVKYLTATHAASIADLRKMTAAEIMATPGDPGESARPIMDGYVLPDMMPAIFDGRQQNDVPLLAGSNADEGAISPTPRTTAAYREYARNAMGPFADEFLALYPADTDLAARKASELIFRDTLFAWPTLQWVKAQAHTGKSKVFYYFLAHTPPAPANEQFVENLGKDFGAYHGAELAYVFENFVPREWAWTDDDRALAERVSQYWVNFATNGDPNGPDLPVWPSFDPGTASVQYLDTKSAAGPLPNQKYYAFWDKVLAGWKGR